MESKLLGISAAARFAGCSEKTARASEAKGIVTAMRDSAGRRLFTPEQAQVLKAHVARPRRA